MDWMSCIRDDVRMVDLVIPGSHDSATYSMRGFAGPFARTQEYDLLAQLACGIRYLDLRVTWSRGRPCIVHNFITGHVTDGPGGGDLRAVGPRCAPASPASSSPQRRRCRSSSRACRRIPSQFVSMIPYLLTIVALAGLVGRSVPPAALGRAED